jgi:hypothetical protein
MNVGFINVAGETYFERFHILPKIVSAIQIHPSDSGAKRLGLITQLPKGAEIEIGGPGFNDQTIQVRCGAASYYVFLEDLDLKHKHADAVCA